MTESHQQPAQPAGHSDPTLHHPSSSAHDTKSGAKIHRVCIGCNNMFEVTMDSYEAKHCPACHKA